MRLRYGTGASGRRAVWRRQAAAHRSLGTRTHLAPLEVPAPDEAAPPIVAAVIACAYVDESREMTLSALWDQVLNQLRGQTSGSLESLLLGSRCVGLSNDDALAVEVAKEYGFPRARRKEA